MISKYVSLVLCFIFSSTAWASHPMVFSIPSLDSQKISVLLLADNNDDDDNDSDGDGDGDDDNDDDDDDDQRRKRG